MEVIRVDDKVAQAVILSDVSGGPGRNVDDASTPI
jgi:hypothetical protein